MRQVQYGSNSQNLVWIIQVFCLAWDMLNGDVSIDILLRFIRIQIFTSNQMHIGHYTVPTKYKVLTKLEWKQAFSRN